MKLSRHGGAKSPIKNYGGQMGGTAVSHSQNILRTKNTTALIIINGSLNPFQLQCEIQSLNSKHLLEKKIISLKSKRKDPFSSECENVIEGEVHFPSECQRY